MPTARPTRGASILVLITLLAATLFVAPAAIDAQANPHQRGPNPNAAGIERAGNYSVATSNVSSFVRGFGGGTIYYPTGTNETFGGIVISPPYTLQSSVLAWYGRRLASHGFVALVIDTNTRYDQPNSRASQILAGVDWLSSDAPSAVRTRLDTSRMGVAGHSMGGGGALAASRSRPSLKASVPLAAWHTTKTFNTSVPQLIIAAQRDAVAPVSTHALPFYNNLPNSTPKLFVEIARADHFVPNSDDATISRTSVAWFKRFVDDDARYNQFLCGTNRPATSDRAISRVMDNCNRGWGSGGATPTPTTAPPTTPTTAPPSSGTCVRSSNAAHVNNDRARSIFGTAYAIGSNDRLGSNSYFVFSSLQQTAPGSWTEVRSC